MATTMQILTKRTFGGLAIAIAVSLGACALFGPARAPDYKPFTTESGVWVKDLTIPTDKELPRVVDGAHVTMHYEIELEDGTLVDSSKERGQAVEFTVGGEHDLPRGLVDGLLDMKRSGRRTMRIPPELAFGTEGIPGLVPANAVLVVTVELLEVAGTTGGA